jgi:hypothetical protein
MDFGGGDRYDGGWEDGRFEGRGVYVYGPGHLILESYEGEFVGGVRCGSGKMWYKDGAMLQGDGWKDGCLTGSGVYFFPTGHRWCKKYHGEFKEDSPSGKGMTYFKDGMILEGNWAAGDFSGHGTIYYLDDFEKSKKMEKRGTMATVSDFSKSQRGSLRVVGDYFNESFGQLTQAQGSLKTIDCKEATVREQKDLLVYNRISFFMKEIKEEDLHSQCLEIIDHDLRKNWTGDHSPPNLNISQNNLSQVDVELKNDSTYVCNCLIC